MSFSRGGIQLPAQVRLLLYFKVAGGLVLHLHGPAKKLRTCRRIPGWIPHLPVYQWYFTAATNSVLLAPPPNS